MKYYTVHWPLTLPCVVEVEAETPEEAVEQARAEIAADRQTFYDAWTQPPAPNQIEEMLEAAPAVRRQNDGVCCHRQVGDDYWYGFPRFSMVSHAGEPQGPAVLFRRLDEDELAEEYENADRAPEEQLAVGYAVELHGVPVANWGVGRVEGETRWATFGSSLSLGKHELEFDTREEAMQLVYYKLMSGELELVAR